MAGSTLLYTQDPFSCDEGSTGCVTSRQKACAVRTLHWAWDLGMSHKPRRMDICAIADHDGV
jgi:hypothetical protein